MQARHGLLTLGVALFFISSAFQLYTASLPLYFANLGYDPTLIGLLIGATGVAEVLAALVVGPSIDRFGARLLLFAGAGAYMAASAGYAWLTAAPALAILRAVQGLGLAATIPSTYSYVAGLAAARRQTLAFASLGAATNVAMAVGPPVGLLLLEQLSPRALFTTAAGAALVGLLVASRVPAPRPSRRPFRLAFRRAWVPPLLVSSLLVVQWGVILAFLPLNTRATGSNPGLLFTADAIAILASRVPAGWAADRYGPFRLALAGIASTVLAVLLLLLPLSDPVLVASGALNGLGGGLIIPPMLAQLSQRSDAATRGTALSYFNVAFATAIVAGSSVGGFLYPLLGFQGLLVAGAALCASGLGVAFRDPLLRQPTRPRPSQPGRV